MFFDEKKSNKKGLTLVELLLVLVIITIILILAIPSIMKAIEENRKRSGETVEKVLIKNLELYNKDNESDFWRNNEDKGCIVVDYKDLLAMNPDIKLGECLININDNNAGLVIKKENTGQYSFKASIVCGKGIKSLSDNKYVYNEAGSTDADIYYKSQSGTCDSKFTIRAVYSSGNVVESYNIWENSGEKELKTKNQVSNNEKVKLPILTRTGYEFVGWNTKPDGTGESILVDNDGNITANEKHDYIYAIWTKDSNLLELSLKDQNKTISTRNKEQHVQISGATGGAGNYTYTEVSEKDSNNANTDYFTIKGDAIAPTITIPANILVGTYYYTVKVTDGNGKEDTATITINIVKGNAANLCPTIKNVEKEYDGEEHTIEVVGSYGGTLEYRTSETEEWDDEKPTRKEVGTTIVHVRLINASNGTDVECGSAKITITSSGLPIPSSPKDKTYNGQEQNSGITCPEGSTASGTQKATNHGTYTQTCTPNSGQKWSDETTGPKNIEWKINKRDVTIKAQDQTTPYGTNIGNDANKVTATGLVEGQSVTGITLTQSTNTVTESGTIKASNAVIKDSSNNTVTSNYNITYADGNLTITKVPAVCPTITAYTGTYDGSGHSITVGNNASGGTVEYRTSPTGEWTSTKPTITNAGTTTIYVRVNGDSNHTTKDCESATVTISAKSLTIPSSPSDKTYNGSEQNSGITCPEGSTASGTQKATNASESAYTQICTLTNTNNYKWSDGSTDPKEIDWKITKKDITIKANPQTIDYGSQINTTINSTTISAEGLINGHQITDINIEQSTSSVTADGKITVSDAVIKDSNNNTVTDNYNITYEDGKLTINAIDVICPTATSYTGTYDGESHSITVGNNATGGTVEYRTATSGEGSNWTTTKPSRTAAGTTTVYIRVNGDENHNNKDCDSKTITINRATSAEPGECLNPTYNGTSQTLAGNGSFVTYTNNTQTNHKANGTYQVTVTPSSNYAWSDGTYSAKTLNCNIAQKPVEYKATDQEKVYDGTPLTANAACILVSGSLVSGNTATCTNTGSQTNAGSSDKTLTSVVIKNSGGTDVSVNYDITKKKGTLTVTKAETAEPGECLNPTYNGSAQTLAGSGKFVTYTNNTQTNHKTSGTYEVTVTPDANHEWVGGGEEPETLNCNIKQKSVEYTATNQSKTYDGQPLTANSACTIKSGDSLVSGHTATCTNTGSQTNAGSSPKTLTNVVIKNSSNTDVSDNYNITKKNGTLTVTRAQTAEPGECLNPTYNGTAQALAGNGSNVSYENNSATDHKASGTYSVSVTPDANHEWTTGGRTAKTLNCNIAKKSVEYTATNQSKTYDGQPLEANNECTIKSGDSLVSGHTATCTNTGSQTNAGSSTKTLTSVVIKNSSDTDVSGNYNITKKNGTLTVTRAKTAEPGECLNPTYNGTAQALAGNGSFVTYANNSQTNHKTSGTYEVTVTPDANHEWTNGGTTSETLNCNIVKREVTYKATNQSKEYDGEPLTANSTCSITSGTLASGHTATCTNTGSQTEVGSSTKTLASVVIEDSSSVDVSSNYAITKVNGTLTVGSSEVRATFYYQSNSTSGSTTISSKSVSCSITSGTSCEVEIPSEVTQSGGTYNNSYAGLRSEFGQNMTPEIAKTASGIEIGEDKDYYALYSSSVTVYKPINSATCNTTNTVFYRNQWFTSKTTMAPTVLTSNNIGTTNNASYTSAVIGYNLYGFADASNTITKTYENLDEVKESDKTKLYAILKTEVTATFYYQSNPTSGSTTVSHTTATANKYIRCASDSAAGMVNSNYSIPSVVTNSVGTYNNAYAGVSLVGNNNMTTVNPTTAYKAYNAIYRSEVTNYYYSSEYTSRTLYRNQWYNYYEGFTIEYSVDSYYRYPESEEYDMVLEITLLDRDGYPIEGIVVTSPDGSFGITDDRGFVELDFSRSEQDIDIIKIGSYDWSFGDDGLFEENAEGTLNFQEDISGYSIPVLATNASGKYNYTAASGPASSYWRGLSTGPDTTTEYDIPQAASSSSTALYTVYNFNVRFQKGNNVNRIGTTVKNCYLGATGATTGTTTCEVTLPSITPNEGYVVVGWSEINGATTGVAPNATYQVSQHTTLYANADCEGIAAKTYTAGETVTYAGQTYTVVSDNGDDVSLVLNNTQGGGAYANANSYLDTEFIEANSTLKAAKNSGCLINQGTSANPAYATTNSGTSDGYTSSRYWTDATHFYNSSAQNKYDLTYTAYNAGFKGGRQNVVSNTAGVIHNEAIATGYTTASTTTVGIKSSTSSNYNIDSNGNISFINASTGSEGTATYQNSNKWSKRMALIQPQATTAASGSYEKCTSNSSQICAKIYRYDLNYNSSNSTFSYSLRSGQPTQSDGNNTQRDIFYICGGQYHDKRIVYDRSDATHFLYGNEGNGNGWSGSSFSRSDATSYLYSNNDGYMRGWFAGFQGTADCDHAPNDTCTGTSGTYIRKFLLSTTSSCTTVEQVSLSDLDQGTIGYRPYIIVKEK